MSTGRQRPTTQAISARPTTTVSGTKCSESLRIESSCATSSGDRAGVAGIVGAQTRVVDGPRHRQLDLQALATDRERLGAHRHRQVLAVAGCEQAGVRSGRFHDIALAAPGVVR
ncbi:MAG: hypothetical protein IPO59_14560 [Betaproteobacteria bacterium]|nr:hypothetical protein [Betaproteobacteria bacterium]